MSKEGSLVDDLWSSGSQHAKQIALEEGDIPVDIEQNNSFIDFLKNESTRNLYTPKEGFTIKTSKLEPFGLFFILFIVFHDSFFCEFAI